MTRKIFFYYDFSSPYTYIAHKRISDIKRNSEIIFEYCPMLLGGLHKLAGVTANAFIENKNQFMKDDCKLVSKKLKINFKFNEKFPINSLNLMRGTLILKEEDLKKYINFFFDAYWQHNLDLSDERIFNNVLKSINLDIDKFHKGIKEQNVKDKLKQLTNHAFSKKIFGAPTFITNNKIFWGQDRLDYAIEEASK
tara:strand:- start:11512 stop:12096 length:585 start_codon:yes stop_codon:yes gene_type:complete